MPQEVLNNVEKLGELLALRLAVAHGCKDYIGLSEYRLAKFMTVNTLTLLFKDRNKAVLQADVMEKNMTEGSSDSVFEESFQNNTHAQRVLACNAKLLEIEDQIQTAKARLNLL